MPIKIIALIIIFFSLTTLCVSQQMPSDSLGVQLELDNSDSISCSIWPNLIRSILIPGWGQIEQENPGSAVIFYGLEISFAYNMAYNYYRFDKNNNPVYRQRFNKYLGLFTEVYILNILDNINTYLKNDCPKWPGTMFSDYPLKSPWGAVARSAMLPGWGQLYNEEYVKSVITFGIVFDFARKVYLNHRRYKDTGSKYQLDRRIVNSWYLGLSYCLVMVDAYVDAYLYNFDSTMELTYNLNTYNDSILIGVSIVF